jgi:hypothetical protein
MAVTQDKPAPRANFMGVGAQDGPTWALAGLGLLGALTAILAYNFVLPLFDTQAFSSTVTAWRFGPAKVADADFWTAAFPLASENLTTYFGATILCSIGAAGFVGFVLARRFSVVVALAVIAVAAGLGVLTVHTVTQGGALREFIVDRVLLSADAVGAVPFCTLEQLNCNLDIAVAFGISAVYSTLFGGVLLALRGKEELADTNTLRERWQSLFAIYIIAMISIAAMALGARLVADYAAAPLAGEPTYVVTANGPLRLAGKGASDDARDKRADCAKPLAERKPWALQPGQSSFNPNVAIAPIAPAAPASAPAAFEGDMGPDAAPAPAPAPDEPAPPEPSDRQALEQLGGAMATYAGIMLGLVLLLGCAPSFVAIRRDVTRAAEAQSEKPRGEWIIEHGLDLGPVKTVLSVAATLAPALLPTIAGMIGQLQAALAAAGAG